MPGTLSMPKELETLTAQHRKYTMKLDSLVKREVFYRKHNEKAESATPLPVYRERYFLPLPTLIHHNIAGSEYLRVPRCASAGLS